MEMLYLSKKKTIYGEALHVIVENTLAFQIGEFGFLDLALWWLMGLFPLYFLHQPNYYLKKKKTNLHQPDLVGTNKSELCIILDVWDRKSVV